MEKTAFIGRAGELEVLEEAFARRGGELAIVYGRRRVGKTELLRRFCRGKKAFFYTARQWNGGRQLADFSEKLAELTGLKGVCFAGWMQAIDAAIAAAGNERLVIVIDEFPYLAQANPGLMSELQAHWDEVLSKKNVMLILCGSAVSFISKHVLGEKNPLYGRARTILKVDPMDFRDACGFYPNFCAEDKFRAYAVLGGIPYYCAAVDDSRPLADSLASLLLRKGGFLTEEALVTLMTEFRDSTEYNGILQAIAFGASGFNEIAQKSLVGTTVLSGYLKVLEDLRLIEKEFPVLGKTGVRGNGLRGIYRLTDAYLRFWFRYVEGQSVLPAKLESARRIWECGVEPKFSEFASPVFEEVCRQHIRNLYLDGKLGMSLASFGRWWSKTDEIDMVGVNAGRTQCLVGECKYRNEPVCVKELAALEAKVGQLPLAQNAVTDRWLFSKSGFTATLTALAAEDQTLHLVTLSDLVPG